MERETDLILRPGNRRSESGMTTSSMDRYELRPFAREAEEQIEKKKEEEQAEINRLRASAFEKGDATEKQELQEIRQEVFQITVPLTREAESPKRGNTVEIYGMSVCLFIAILTAISYWYAEKKKKEREKHLAGIDSHSKKQWQTD